MKSTTRHWLGMFLFFLGTVIPLETGAKKPDSKSIKSPHRSVHTYQSILPYLAHALRDCRCHEEDDVFEKRACKKNCAVFQKKMLGWASKNPVIHTDLRLRVADYDFRTKSFVLSHTDSLNPESRYQRVDQDGVILGSNTCERVDGELTSMVETKLVLKAKMKESAAKQSVLRGAGSVEAVALLKGKPTRVNWCCGDFMRRAFAMDKTPCSSRGFAYSVKEIAVGFDPIAVPSDDAENAEDADTETNEQEAPGSWRLGFKTSVLPVEFTPKLIGLETIPGNMED